ncbi:MAG: peptidoglycan -binding protein [Alphaproteobacteria bacterium]|nr:peptidoglycan -binding protein [Alphaproteobacteria bacterium]
MARARTKRLGYDPWAGFVDVLSTLLLVIVFLLTVFVLAQNFLTQALSGRDRALKELSAQIAELAETLNLERRQNADLRESLAVLSASLARTEMERDELVLKVDALTRRSEEAEKSLAVREDEIRLRLAELESLKRDIDALRRLRAELEGQVAALTGESEQLRTRGRELEGRVTELADERERLRTRSQELEGRVGSLESERGQLRDRTRELEARLADERERTLLAQKEIEQREIRLSQLQSLYLQTQDRLEGETKVSEEARAQVDLLNQQIAALRAQLARLEAALEVAEARDKESQVQIADLGRRLNLALAQKVEELSQYRSEFFGELRKVLGNRPDVQIVGDRFVLQSEVLFDRGSAELSENARRQLDSIARTLIQVSARIPDRLPWILRVDGHTDALPISTPQFPSNWELSTARAVAVSKYMISRGVPPSRIAAAGFGEFQPLDPRSDEIAYRRNRRIEMKLTER